MVSLIERPEETYIAPSFGKSLMSPLNHRRTDDLIQTEVWETVWIIPLLILEREGLN